MGHGFLFMLKDAALCRNNIHKKRMLRKIRLEDLVNIAF